MSVARSDLGLIVPVAKSLEASGMSAPSSTQLLTLRDGRRLCYAEYGAQRGLPVIFMHGLFGSRFQRHPNEAIARDLGVRLIVPERSGFGNSDFMPDRRLADWPADVAQLIAALRLGTYAIAGISGGGPYALACAAALEPAAVAVISGVGRIEKFNDGREVAWQQRLLFTLARASDALARLPVGLMALGLRHDPQRFFAILEASVSAQDRNILQRPEVRALLLKDMRTAMAQGARGLAHEVRILSRPWDVSLARIRCPVDVWHGTDDTWVPQRMAAALVQELPQARLHWLKDAGHFLALDYWERILATLMGRLRAMPNNEAHTREHQSRAEQG